MEYLLNENIIFNVEDNTLINKHSPEQRLEITLTASRLLLLLVRHQGNVLTRDTILKAVWEDYGLNASNSSLNQYISVLRGMLRSLEITGNVIETVPRIGFMLSAELNIIRLHSPEVSAAADTSAVAGELSVAEPNPTVTTQAAVRYQPRLPLTVLMLSALVALIYVNIVLQKQAPYTLTFISSGHYQGCRIRTLPMYKHDNNFPSQALLLTLIRISGLSCTPGGEFYVHIDGNVAHGRKGKAWVSSCERKKDNGTLQCRDYFSNDWEVPQ